MITKEKQTNNHLPDTFNASADKYVKRLDYFILSLYDLRNRKNIIWNII